MGIQLVLMLLSVGGARLNLMIAFVSNQGEPRWMIDEAFNSDKFIEFLASLVKDAGRKVFVILDNGTVAQLLRLV